MANSNSPSILRRINQAVTAVRSVTVNLLFIVLVLFVLALLIGSCQSVSVPENAALVVNPEGALVERASAVDPLQQVISGTGVKEVELQRVLQAIEHAATDSRITLLLLNFDKLTYAAPAHAERIGQALAQFKTSGKEVIAYGHFFNQPGYQMASFADALYLHPQGQVTLFGYGNYAFYFKEILDRFDINVHVFRVGDFKSAIEPFTRTDMSPDARMANAALFDTLWQNTAQVVAANRKLQPADVHRYAESFDDLLQSTGGDIARAALEQHLVDELLSDDQARVRIGEKVGFAADGNLNGINYLQYLDANGMGELPTGELGLDDSPAIAVLTSQGIVTNADHNRGVIGAQATINLIRQARRDPNIKALVVRVDSPGGSQFASELIRQELELLQLAGKPVVASFGANAASGGYWIAATSDHIAAERSTITGSIGIFAMTTTYEESLGNLGIYTDGVGTSPLSRGISPFVGLSAEVKSVIQSQVEHGYRQFIELVARGRSMELAAVESMAQGRVWSGEVAQELGLVDSIGGLDHALAEAAALASLTDYRTLWLTDPIDARQLLLRQMFTDASVTEANTGDALIPAGISFPSLLDKGLIPLQEALFVLGHLNDPNQLYTLCDSCQWRSVIAQSAEGLRLLQ